MSVSYDDLKDTRERLQEQLNAMQRHQMAANSRIRQDVMATLVIALCILGAPSYKDAPWYEILAEIAAALVLLQIAQKAIRRQEEPRN